ncbi:OPT family oligopeptide transporter [Lachnospira multipara]|uniref:OPT family oligopeptide transporter n=1 Tax=Lachnospira multipara TaxID=28051 RepID=UPI0004E1EF7F|nr:oligopeptide transporter, OPT family [Lachnospira multipara]
MANNKDFKPYISADQVMPEITPTSVILGVLLAVIFGAANAYLGLRVGMTVSASIPAAVISMGVIRMILKKDSILENNLVQTIGSAGESVAAGAIFTLPAIFMWIEEGYDVTLSVVAIAVVSICGGLLGVLFMIPLRKALIVKEHGVLPYPEGTACAEVLIAGEEGGNAAGTVFAGLGIAAAFKFIADGLKLFPSEISYSFKSYKGSGVGMDTLPALLGVGYICGARISSYMMAGGILAWLVIMPLLVAFGADATVFPATVQISQMTVDEVWSSYIRYIGAGAVAAGGIISLVKSLPLIVKTFGENIKSLKNSDKTASTLRTDKDLDIKVIILIIAACLVVLVAVPSTHINIGTALLIVIFGFFFATVSSRMVGLVGSSNNPVSGMAIATLIITTVILKATGVVGGLGMTIAIMIGTVICIIAAIAGDTSQDLKTGYIIGSTPRNQQIGEIIGVIAAGLAMTGVMVLLNNAWGFGTQELPAPQATLMKLVVEGVMGGNLPWNLVFVGVFIAVVIEFLAIPVLPVAIGLYLPIHLSVPIMIGGLIRYWLDHKKYKNDGDKDKVTTAGILYSSGLIAGEGLVGIILAVFAVISVGNGNTIADVIDLTARGIDLGSIGSLVFFLLLTLSLIKFTVWNKKNYK